MMRLIGALLLLIAALGVIRGYRKFLRARAEQYTALCDFLAGLERYLSTTAASVDRYMSTRPSAILDGLGFFDEYERSGRLSDAFSTVAKGLYISERAVRMLENYFAGFGTGYLDAELRSVAAANEELLCISSAEQSSAEQSMRVVSVFAVSISVGIAILLC